MRRKFFIIVPAAVKESPVKGAVALANELSRHRSVTFITLKKGAEEYHSLDEGIDRVSLWTAGSWPSRLLALRSLLKKSGGRNSVGSISLCLSSDFMNSFCHDLAVTCSSVRGNLPKVYSETYGKLGKFIAYRHIKRLRRLDHVVSMTTSMAQLVESVIGRSSPIIGNFLDEPLLEQFRRKIPNEGPLKFVYTGSLDRGKRPELLIQAVRTLHNMNVDVKLDIYGDGPLLRTLKEMAATLMDPQAVCFYGYISLPFPGVAGADALVLPSVSEGTSRSVLEALFLGVPCVLRNVDGNSELVNPYFNGALFDKDEKLAQIMLNTARWSRREGLFRTVLVPDRYRQQTAVKKFIDLLEGESHNFAEN
jgi:glycosyltransferase involved in cell wall biosynthesis